MNKGARIGLAFLLATVISMLIVEVSGKVHPFVLAAWVGMTIGGIASLVIHD